GLVCFRDGVAENRDRRNIDGEFTWGDVESTCCSLVVYPGNGCTVGGVVGNRDFLSGPLVEVDQGAYTVRNVALVFEDAGYGNDRRRVAIVLDGDCSGNRVDFCSEGVDERVGDCLGMLVLIVGL